MASLVHVDEILSSGPSVWGIPSDKWSGINVINQLLGRRSLSNIASVWLAALLPVDHKQC